MLPVDRGDNIHRVIRHYDIADDHAPARAESTSHSPEQIGFSRAVEVVHGQGGHDEVKRPGGQLVLQPGDSQLGGR